MRSATIRDLLAAQPVLAGLEPGDLDLMAGCGRNRVVEIGTFLASEDDSANEFFVLRAGQVALEIDSPTGPLVIETIGAGQLVGWSWIFPPHRWVYDVEVLEEAHVIAIDATCLRAKVRRRPGVRLSGDAAVRAGRRRTVGSHPAPAARPLRERRCPLTSGSLPWTNIGEPR